ncbi:hypothetical protein PN471_10525 [Aphanizomenon sp. CS-733/32]|uniref:hypothetical protein n=1 Tax=Aphanizomenon sp. CS-733/32 TaxID=3021715 RepID=UPI00232E141A|nr:hypothetical protein [Aphanizomenon sp. CS-733/32]MDB9309066.1 hypothetical protein [Aphanizomenon sp. CS-733/32]
MNRKQYLVLDTNILVSAVLAKTSKARQALDKAQDIGKILRLKQLYLNHISLFNKIFMIKFRNTKYHLVSP